jgi:chromosome segregation ATPase
VQNIATLQRDLGEAQLQNEQLKLEVLRWRKQSSLLRLKLASAEENVQITERNLQVLAEREQQTSTTISALKSELDAANQQLTAAVAAKAMAQAESAKYQVLGAN